MTRLGATLAATDWGSVPAWLSSFAAVLAVLFAATAAVISRRTFGIQSEQHRAAIEAARRAGDAPSCFEEVLEVGRSLQRSGAAREVIAVRVGPGGDPFLVWPLLSSGGVWLFGKDASGAWNPDKVGIDSPESISGFERFAALGESGEGIIRREMDQAWIDRTFLSGACPFMLGAYGDVARARNSGLRVAVSPVPGFRNGGPPRPFVTIYGFYIAPFGKNRVIASDLLTDYLTRLDVMSALSARIGAPVARIGATALTDPATHDLLAACDKGVTTPSFAQMPAVWGHLGRAEADVIAGTDPSIVARRAAAAIRQAVADGGPSPSAATGRAHRP